MLGASYRDGWAAPGMNFAGAGFRYNLGARPRGEWDFNAKIHDLHYYANVLSFGGVPQDPSERSRLEKADYIFRQLDPVTNHRISAKIYGLVSNNIFLGKDRNHFLKDDNFYNVIEHPSLSIEHGHFMIPWSEISKQEQRHLSSLAKQSAIAIIGDCTRETLKFIKVRYDLNVARGIIIKGNRRRKETVTDRKKRLIRELTHELKFNIVSTLDSYSWRDWAARKYGDIWQRILDVQ